MRSLTKKFSSFTSTSGPISLHEILHEMIL